MSHALSPEAQQVLDHLVVPCDGPDWLAGLRRDALESFHGLPGRHTEEWKYTPVPYPSVLSPMDIADPIEPASPGPLMVGVPRIVLVNGTPVESPAEPVPGLGIERLSKALESPDPVLAELITALPSQGVKHAFSQLNTAKLCDGLYLHVDAGVDAGTLLLQWSCGPDDFYASRVCIVLEQGARLHLVEQFENAAGQAARLNLVGQFRLGPDARLEHSRLHQYPAGSLLIDRTEVGHAERSRYAVTCLDLGLGLARFDVRSQLDGEGAASEIRAAVLGRDRAHSDCHFESDHRAPGCQSGQWFRAVGSGHSKTVFNGRVHIAAGADASEARQSSAGLLLTRRAEIDAKPELEIHADEVIAAHGATVGELDRAALFYLRSRGLGESEARRMLTRAFCRSVIDRVPEDALRAALESRFDAAMQSIDDED